jgi:hypothetical protein
LYFNSVTQLDVLYNEKSNTTLSINGSIDGPSIQASLTDYILKEGRNLNEIKAMNMFTDYS